MNGLVLYEILDKMNVGERLYLEFDDKSKVSITRSELKYYLKSGPLAVYCGKMVKKNFTESLAIFTMDEVRPIAHICTEHIRTIKLEETCITQS